MSANSYYAQPRRKCDNERWYRPGEQTPVHPQAEARRRAEALRDLLELTKLLTRSQS